MTLNHDEIEKKVCQNTGLVYHIVEKIMGIEPENLEHDDMVQCGMIGLLKAAKTFDESKEIKFSTYAGKCIRNEILMYLRKVKRNKPLIVSLQQTVNETKNGDKLNLEDVIEDENSEKFVKRVEDMETIQRTLSYVLNMMSHREKIIFLYIVGGIKQGKIGNILKLSQSYISRLANRISEKLSNLTDKIYIRKGPYKVSVKEANIKIQYTLRSDYEVFRAQNWIEKYSKSFKIMLCQNQISFILPASADSFLIIADFVMQVEDVTYK